MDNDEEDYVFYGTPIEREEDLTSRKKKATAEASGQLRTLVPWKQEVRDEEGRRRFHGAFTGGYSAGYYNTVGSKEGWTPQTFTSSRNNRAQVAQQNILNFMDDEEKAELDGNALGTSMQFDTFGFTAAEFARKQSEKEQQKRPSIIPGPAPDELVVPTNNAIGVKLLKKMGWRHGRAIRDSLSKSSYGDALGEARDSFMSISPKSTPKQLDGMYSSSDQSEKLINKPLDSDDLNPQSTPMYTFHLKQDQYGLGYDPYKSAPEFREMKRSRLSGIKESGNKKIQSLSHSIFASRSERIGPGFGIGALEELDAEDEDVYTSGYNFEETYIQEIEEPTSQLKLEYKKESKKEMDTLPGFKMSSTSNYKQERFEAPAVPRNFASHHIFPSPLDVSIKTIGPPPPEISPPQDDNLRILIDGVATLVARCGKLFEDLSREKNQSNPLFAFLSGGDGFDYYSRKLWEERHKCIDQNKQPFAGKTAIVAQKMTAEHRGRILGEKPLERSSKDTSLPLAGADIQLGLNLTDTFIKPRSMNEVSDVSKPFGDEPAKQERFEQFFKDKYQGGIRTKDSGGSSNMSEAARARERLEFETAAEAIQKGKSGKEFEGSNQNLLPYLGSVQFTSGGQEQIEAGQSMENIMKKLYPRREEFQWRPAAILCKRFDLIDPYMGKPPPAPRTKSKLESLLFMPISVEAEKSDVDAVGDDSLTGDQSGVEKLGNGEDDGSNVNVQTQKIDRPVDLYKAIFSDDSDAEEENSNVNLVENSVTNPEAANSTLNRLIAGDFLESLGKELGLVVPPDLPFPESKSRTQSSTQKKTDMGDMNMPSYYSSSSINTTPKATQNETAQPNEGRSKSSGKGNNSETRNVGLEVEKRKHRLHRSNNTSSEDEKKKKKSKKKHSRRRHRSIDYSDSSSAEDSSSDEYRRGEHSRSKRSSKGGSSNKRTHSKSHKRRRDDNDSPRSRSSQHRAEKGWTRGEEERKKH
ncbi:G patch domain-containing protein TGH isoform X2 [Impatiens glandulifera]|uniref:G patch domain-containing protein TGH isoform X2 n=1 Tax=Impatiens glandulifera TaxID=253017 RepID=UPI001FB0A3E6|nr:G patch domain-containing protein TGH isoform X2 [Impatiens glandulifera]